jgi:choline kinase
MNAYDLIILAAGRGSRMKSLTNDSPKCLTVLLGRSLLDWQLDAAKSAGFESIHIIGGYSVGKLPADLVDFVNPRWAETNMVATLFQARELLSAKPCIVAYSDIVYRPEHLTTLASSENECAVLYDLEWEKLWRRRSENFLADAESFKVKAGCLLTIGEKNPELSEIEGQYMGLLKFTPNSWLKISRIYDALPVERRDKIDSTSFLRLLLSEGVKIAAVPISGGWVEVDTENDRDIYEAAIRKADVRREGWSHDWRINK